MPDPLAQKTAFRSPADEAPLTKLVLILVAGAFLTFFVSLPLITVFLAGSRGGWSECWLALSEPDAIAAIRLPLTVAAIAVPLNRVFGVAAAWAIAKFEFKGKAFLITLIDLPFSISPVISGLVYV